MEKNEVTVNETVSVNNDMTDGITSNTSVETSDEPSFPSDRAVEVAMNGETLTEESESDLSRTGDVTTGIRRTYVPRFTEASEIYRTKGDSRIISKLKMKNQGYQVNTEKKDKVYDIDPTAEFDELNSDVVVNVPDRKLVEENAETINVFKSRVEEDITDEIDNRTVEDEAAEISELLNPKREDQEQEEAEIQEEVTPVSEEPVVTIPDPVESDFGVFEFENIAPESHDRPSGAESSLESTRNKNGKIEESEFTNPVQRDGFKDKFLDSLISKKIRFAAALVFVLALLSVEVLVALGVISHNVFSMSVVPSTLALMDYLFATCILVMSAPEIVRSVKQLFAGKLQYDLIPLFNFAVLTVYTVTISVTNAGGYPLFGFLFAMSVIPTISASIFKTKADFISFKMVSRNEEKYVIDSRPTRELDQENMALDGLIDEYDSKIARTFRTVFVSDFYSHSNNTASVPSCLGLSLIITFATAFVSGIIAFFLSFSIVTAVSVLSLVSMLGLPAFSILAGKIPFFHAQKAALKEESTAVGEGAYHKLSDVNVVAFEDTDIFGPDDVKLVRYSIDMSRMQSVFGRMCGLFAVIGGPLDYMFNNAIDNRVRYKTATNVVIEDDGVSGDVKGHRMCAGTEEYIRRNRIAFSSLSTGKTSNPFDTTKVMYIAEDGVVCATLHIRYSFSEEFSMLLPTIREEGVIPLIYTRDPNISNELLNMLTASTDVMRVVRMYRPIPEEKVYGRVSADMITYGDKLDATSMVLLSKKYKKFSDLMQFAQICSSGIGALLALVLSLIGINVFTPLIAVIWQIVWCFGIRVMSKMNFLKSESEKNDD